MIEPTDDLVLALWRVLPSEVQDGREPDDIRPWLAAVLNQLALDQTNELTELRALFDLQWTRSREADARWRAEDPEARANISPDLGAVLKWLMDDADRIREQLAAIERDRCLQPRGHRPLRKPTWLPGRGANHPHYCVSCSDGETQGPGCINCRQTGMDQTPWPHCEGCREGKLPADEHHWDTACDDRPHCSIPAHHDVDAL